MAASVGGFKSRLPAVCEKDSTKRNLDPFWATRLWQHLVQHVKRDVRVGRRRHLFRNYEAVFDGSDIMSVVHQCLSNCASATVHKPVTKKSAIKVCQVLMDNKLFESVVPKDYPKFEEGSSRLYRFASEVKHEIPNEEEDKENIESLHSSPPVLRNRTVTGQWATKRFSSQNHGKKHLHSLRRTASFVSVTDLSSLIPGFRRKAWPTAGRTSLRSFSQFQDADDITEEVHKMIWDQTLMHLLALINVPILEGILNVPLSLGKVVPSAPQLVVGNSMRKSFGIALPSKFGNISNIPWVSAASACIERQPEGLEKLWSLQACKLLCYQTVLDYYSRLPEPLVPGAFVPLCTATIELVKSDKRSKALLSSQLLLILLPWQRRQQLRCLLTFLHLVIEDIFVSVDKKVTNYEAVSRDFLSSVMCHPCVSKENFQILFDFMLYRIYKVFQKPSCLNMEHPSDLAFCKRISCSDFRSMSQKQTAEALKDLSFFVMDSTSMKLAEKKQWLKSLKRFHPEIHRQCESS